MSAGQTASPRCIGLAARNRRARAIVHALSTELFGKSLAVPDFPVRRDIKGIGLSDWDGYAERLVKKLDYTNTCFHRQPMLDITDIPESMTGSLDFVIASDAYEHIAPPVTREIREHRGHPVLHNRTRDGRTQVFSDLIFHGGTGSTLEMRVFSLESLMTYFSSAGFVETEVYGDSYFEHGIYWRRPFSVPLAARTVVRQKHEVSRRRSDFRIDAWGPHGTAVGQPFNLQADGSSAFWARGQGFDRVRYLSLGDYRLKTTVAEGGAAMSAQVPPDLIRVSGPLRLRAVCSSGGIFDIGEFTVVS
jgi:hypothetical protein